jgi:hypothetical protein
MKFSAMEVSDQAISGKKKADHRQCCDLVSSLRHIMAKGITFIGNNDLTKRLHMDS